MGGRRGAKRPSCRVNVKLDSELDADLIAWMKAQPGGTLSQAIRETLRRGLEVEGQAQQHCLDYEHIREIVADELGRALAELRFQPQQGNLDSATSEAEDQYGARLDRMLGGFLDDQ